MIIIRCGLVSLPDLQLLCGAEGGGEQEGREEKRGETANNHAGRGGTGSEIFRLDKYTRVTLKD